MFIIEHIAKLKAAAAAAALSSTVANLGLGAQVFGRCFAQLLLFWMKMRMKRRRRRRRWWL